MIERVPMSTQGYQKLRDELQRLEKVERFDVVKAIEVARAHGDLKENAEYHAAKEKQSIVEGRIAQLQGILARSRVVEVSKITSKKIVFGATVSIFDAERNLRVTYKIVGEDEFDIKRNRISWKSPLAAALLGKKLGDEIKYEKPNGGEDFLTIEAIVYK